MENNKVKKIHILSMFVQTSAVTFALKYSSRLQECNNLGDCCILLPVS